MNVYRYVDAYSSLVVRHHVLFSRSRWEGRSKGGSGAEWEVGVTGGGLSRVETCVCVCVCVEVEDD